MPLSDWLQVLRPAVEETLHQVVAEAFPPGQGQEVPPWSELRSMLTYHLGWEGPGSGPEAQGKRIRPLLVLLSTAAAGGRWQSALPGAAGVELLHNFSLLHDDIQDQSPTRRGRPTVWTRWGVAQAINAGDAMFTLVPLALARLAPDHAPAIVVAANRIVFQGCARLTIGQYLDIAYEQSRQLPLEAYWPMIEGKTAALLAACTGLGALLGGADAAAQEKFTAFGRALGLAFQALDDILGIWGDEALTGKSTSSDLISGKKTLPVLYGLKNDGPFAHRWLAGSITAAEAPELAAMLAAEGARSYTQERADRLTAEALDWLDQAAAPGAAAGALRELTEYLLHRQQ